MLISIIRLFWHQTNQVTLLPLQQTDLEPLEVVLLLPLLSDGELLGPRRAGPLLGDVGLFKSLPDGTGTGSSGESREGVRSEDHVSVREGLSGNASGGTVDQGLMTTSSVPHAHHLGLSTHSVVVNDLGNDGELSGERSVVDEDDSADFDESLEGGRSLNLNRGRDSSQSS